MTLVTGWGPTEDVRAMKHRPSPNCEPRPAGVPVDMLVIHYTGMPSADAALERMCDPTSKVSAHYCIDEDGTVTRLVPEEMRAWHAGVSSWRGHDDVNSRSIGIELVNPGHEFGYREFPEAQVRGLIRLAAAIVRRRRIPARNVVGHSDVAPSRKQDPGELFPWRRLAAAGIGLWPAPVPADPGNVEAMLSEYGYRAEDEGALSAFQRHFRPARIDGLPDEESAALLAGLLAIAD